MIPFVSKVALLGNDLAIKHKQREFLVTLICASFKLQQCELNTCFSPRRSKQDGVNSLVLKMKEVASFCMKTASLFTQKRHKVYSFEEE